MAAAVTTFPSPTNVFLPAFESTGDMVVAYSRHPNQFPLNEYIKIVPVDKLEGYYLFVNPQQAIRFQYTDLREYAWPDGQFRTNWASNDPSNNLQIKWRPYLCNRYDYGASYGEMTVQQAQAWDLIGEQSGQLATKAMVARTIKAQAVLAATTGQTATATTAGGGFWSAGAIGTPYIRKSIGYGARSILAATAGALSYKDLILVVSPKVAVAMADSDEMYHFVSNQQSSPDIQRDAGNERNYSWQLPDRYAGVKIVVEDTQYNSNQIGSANTDVAQDVMDGNTAYLMARPGSLVSGGGKSFSSLIFPVYKKFEMLMEVQEDPFNHLWRANLADAFDCQAAAPESVFQFTAVLS